MKHKLFEGLTPKEVLDNLQGICHSKQEMVYEKKLSDQELQKEEKEFIQDNVKLAKLNDDFDRIKQEFKSKMKPVEQVSSYRQKLDKALEMGVITQEEYDASIRGAK